jgi:hypothetical protein
MRAFQILEFKKKMSKTTFNINATSKLSVSPVHPHSAEWRRKGRPRRAVAALKHAPAHPTPLQSDKLQEFIARRLEGNLTEVPLIGPKTEEKLIEAGISTTFQLCGKFLSFKESPDTTSEEICQAFYAWLAAVGVTAGRSPITLAIAEKVAVAFPACVDTTVFIKGDMADE